MSESYEEAMIRNMERQGPKRIQLLMRPALAQVENIPLGSDTVIITPTQIAGGVWDERTREMMADNARKGHGVLGAVIAYLPPEPTPESALTGEQIAEQVFSSSRDLIGLAGSGDLDSMEVFRTIIVQAVAMAREGMVHKPF